MSGYVGRSVLDSGGRHTIRGPPLNGIYSQGLGCQEYHRSGLKREGSANDSDSGG